MGKVKIYYFSGTGNSLYVARELQKRIPETTLIPMVSLLDKDVIETRGETVGFVFPTYFMTVPFTVKSFIKKLDIKSAKYIFAITTRGGTISRAFIDIDKVLEKKGRSLDAYFVINMAYNDPKFNYKVPTQEEIAKLESEVQDRLDSIQNIILNKEKSREKDTSVVTPVPSLVEKLIPLLSAFSENAGFHYNFYINEKCTGCGICERVCLSRKIKMIDNRPVWQKNVICYTCDACIDYCPVQSIQIKSLAFMKFNTEKNGRYSHPYANINDIAGQKK